MPPASVHFNGSVNLPDAETVMREISARIPRGLRRMTEGETAERNYWILFQVRKLQAMPEFTAAGIRRLPVRGNAPEPPPMPQLRLAGTVAADDVSWPDLGYAAAYTSSYGTFRALRDDGTIPAGVRFQVQYPTPLAVVSGTIAAEDSGAVLASYERALFADLGRALARLPHDQLAVQWDVAVEVGLLEGWFGEPAELAGIAPGLIRCIDQLPAEVPVGMHLCYGDYQHRHFSQPESLDLQVRMANAVTAGAHRPVDWFSFTVPQSQRGDGYFAPLRELRAGTETELAFALVPYYPADQAPGTTGEQVRLIDSHLAASPAGRRDWGICTECGMGRVDADDVPVLLDMHREILAAYGPGAV